MVIVPKGGTPMATAREVMIEQFHTLRPESSVAEAVKQFKIATEEEHRRVFGMLVTDEGGHLIGMVSMYDILLFIRPKHVHIWGVMDDIDTSGLLEELCEKVKSVRVDDIMTTDIITVTPDTHIMVVLDIMIKKHVRRIPVIDGDNILGIVYISDLFNFLAEKFV
jgi:CBS domain-containing protein